MTQTIAELTFDDFDRILAQFDDEADREVEVTLFEIEAGTKRDAPVDKGLLRNSYQVEKTGTAEGAVFTVTSYAPHVEFGTHRSRAQPHLGPNAEAQRGLFIERMRRIGSRLR